MALFSAVVNVLPQTAGKAPRENAAKRKRPQALGIKRNSETADSPPSIISEA